MRETQVQCLGREDPLEKAMTTHSGTLAWKIPWTEEPCRLQSTGSQRVGHERLHFYFHFQPSPGAYGLSSRVNGNSKRTYTKGRLPGAAASTPHPRGEPLLTHASTGDPPTLQGRSGSSVRSLLLFSKILHARFYLCSPRVESLFPPVL